MRKDKNDNSTPAKDMDTIIWKLATNVKNRKRGCFLPEVIV